MGTREIREWLAWVIFVPLLVVLAPMALVTVFVVFHFWQTVAIAAGGMLLAVALHRARARPAFFYAAGVMTAMVGWIFTMTLSGWDIEGRLDDGAEPPWFDTVLFLAIGGGVLGSSSEAPQRFGAEAGEVVTQVSQSPSGAWGAGGIAFL